MRINGDIIFIDTSGQVRSRYGDLTLRADDSGSGSIIIGSGLTLRPESNRDIHLGLSWLRWNTLFACSGSFLERPSVNNSGVLLQGEQGVFGDYRQDAVSDAISFTPLIIFQNKVTMTTPFLPSGQYRIGWNCEYATDKASRNALLRVNINSTTLANPTPNTGPGANTFFPACGFGYTTISGINTITLDFATEMGGGPTYNVFVRRARLEVWKVT